MKVAVLGSGSGGNATLVQAGGTRVLLDAGLSGRDIAARLDRLGVDPDTIDAILVTHEHGDHTRGMGVFARRHGTTLYLTERTLSACRKLLNGVEATITYRPGMPFRIGGVRVEPFLTVHDAVDPVGVAVADSESGLRLGLATDLGRPNAQIRHALSGCDFLILEANHDERLLHQAPYPWSVKNRITSSHGHLSNEAAARFVVELLHPRLTGVLLAHLSREANRPELALDVVSRALEKAGFRGFLDVAHQDEPTGWIDIEKLRRANGPEQLSLL